MLKILVCGEGNHDIGSEDWDPHRKQRVSQEGWLQGILRQLIEQDVEFQSVRRKDLIFLPRDEARYKPRPPGHGARALAAAIRAKADKADLVVFMADADTRNVSDWKRRHKSIHEGFALCSEVSAVACVPKAASESWLLADERAWKHLGLQDLKLLPGDPEGIWGLRDDPAGNHPHRLFARVCAAAGVADDTHTRSELGMACRIEVLTVACPVSFATFKLELGQAIAA